MNTDDDPGLEPNPADPTVAQSPAEAASIGDPDLRAEVERLQSELESLQSTDRSRRSVRARSIAGGALAVLAAISIVVATVAVWLHETLLDTETFIATVSPVFSDPAVTDPVGAYLTEQTFDALQVEERVNRALSTADDFIEEQVLGLIDLNPRVENRLAAVPRPRFADLTAPIVTATESAVRDAVQEYLRSDRFEATFTKLATRAHESAVALLRGDYGQLPKVVVDTNSVQLDLTPAIAQTVQELVDKGVGIVGFDPPSNFLVPVDTPETARAWLSDTFNRELAPEFAQITIMSTDRLAELQDTVRIFDRWVWILIFLALLLVVAAIWVTPRRSRGVVQVVVAVVAAGVITWLIVDRLQLAVVDAFGAPADREAARSLLGFTLANLRTLGLIVLAAAALVGVGAFALGRGWIRAAARWASEPRDAHHGATQVDRFVASHYDGLRVAGIALAVVLLLITGIGFAPVIVIGLVLALYLWMVAVLRDRAATGTGAEPEVFAAVDATDS